MACTVIKLKILPLKFTRSLSWSIDDIYVFINVFVKL